MAEIRSRLQKQTAGTRGGKRKRHDEPSIDDRASDKFKARSRAGYTVATDSEQFDDEAREQLIRDLIEAKHYPEKQAREIARAVMLRDRKTLFLTAANDSISFFHVEQKPGGLTEIVFNTNHVVYDKLVLALDQDVRGATESELVGRIRNAADTIRLLFAAWARYEIEDVPNRPRIQETRYEWGKMARAFLEDEAE